MKTFISILFGTSLLFILSCKKDEPLPDTCTKALTYDADIKAIINANCNVTGCHDGVNTMRKPLTNYQQVKAVLAGVEERAVVKKIMPPAPKGGPLSDEDIALLRCWIDLGAPEK